MLSDRKLLHLEQVIADECIDDIARYADLFYL